MENVILGYQRVDATRGFAGDFKKVKSRAERKDGVFGGVGDGEQRHAEEGVLLQPTIRRQGVWATIHRDNDS